MPKHRYTAAEVLRFSVAPPARSTVAVHYRKWRNNNGMPKRCDNQECALSAGKPIWNGKPLGLIVDHINGNKCDNAPKNLRLLCPNCDSQNDTRGGKNIGRIRNQTPHGFDIFYPDGRRGTSVVLQGVGATAAVGTITAQTNDA